MSETRESYGRFSSLPSNIARYGTTLEEVNLQKGKPDANPVVAPMASPALSQKQLALSPSGSDKLRLYEPSTPRTDPYEGPKPRLVHTRLAATKLDGAIFSQIAASIVSSKTPYEQRLQSMMKDSLRRVHLLKEFLERTNKWTEAVYIRTITNAKG